MLWNYRVVKINNRNHGEIYNIHKVFYNDDKEIRLIDRDPIEIKASGKLELQDELADINRAVIYPTIILGSDRLEGDDVPDNEYIYHDEEVTDKCYYQFNRYSQNKC